MTDNKRIAYNSIILFARFCISTIIGIFSSRFVLQALGVSDFGLYNVIGGIVALLNVVNSTMVATTYRYIAAELGKKEHGNPNKVFNVSFMIHFVFSLIVLVLGLFIGLYYVNNYLNVDSSRLTDARFVLIVSISTTCLSTLTVPYNGLLIAHEKFKPTAIIDVSSQILRFIAIIILVHSSGNHLRWYSVLMMGYVLYQAISYLAYSLKNYMKIVKIRLYHEWSLYKEMLNFSLWTFYSSVANIGRTQGSTMILNFFFGTVVNASYAIGCQVANYVQVFASNFTSAAIPQITKSFNAGDTSRSMSLTCYISKYSFILMSIIAFPAIMDMEWLLKMWLGCVPEGAVLFCDLIVLETLFGCLGAGIAGFVQAQGNIKVFQLIVYSLLLLGLPLSYLLYKIGFGVYTISIVYCIISLLQSLLKLIMLKVYYKMDISNMLRIAYLRIILIMSVMLLAFLFMKPFGETIASHIAYLGTSEILLIIIIALLGLDSNEWNVIKLQISKLKI